MEAQNNVMETLQRIANQKENNISKAVAVQALKNENPENFFSEIYAYRDKSGSIPSLNTIEEGQTFFEGHYKEIEAIRMAAQEETPLKIEGDLKLELSRFAFYQKAFELCDEYGRGF